MDLTDKQTIQFLLKNRGLRPLKRFGQNFLINKDLPQQLVAAAEIKAEDTVLEIGPGIGAITQALAQKAKRIVAVEKDRNMVEILKETLKEFKNVEIICDDIRRSDLPLNFGGGLTSQKYKVVGNLPFYLTAPVIRQFLELAEVGSPLTMTLVVQKEVAQRICAKPPKMSILANSVQFYADPKIISIISKESFWPKPEVDAAIIEIRSTKSEIRNNIDKNLFFKIMKAGFSHPRKQLINNLVDGLKMDRGVIGNWLKKNNISAPQRAETLSIDDWVNLTKSFVL